MIVCCLSATHMTKLTGHYFNVVEVNPPSSCTHAQTGSFVVHSRSHLFSFLLKFIFLIGHYAYGSQSVNGVPGYGAEVDSNCGAGASSVGSTANLLSLIFIKYHSGNYQPQSSQSSCITCPAGHICPSANQVTPQACATGEYQPTTGSGASTCPGCPVGTFTSM